MKTAFQEICQSGFSKLGFTKTLKEEQVKNPWQWQSAWPPSYEAMGRFRFLQTLTAARSIKFQRSLEVAGGDGFLGACLWQPDRTIVINDIRDLAHERTAWINGDKIQFLPGDLFGLTPQTVGLFDLVIACEVLEHVAYGKEMIEHLVTFLKPGGTLLLTTPNGSYFRSKLPTYSSIRDFSVFESRQFQPDADGHLYLYTKKDLEGILQAAGMKNISIHTSITPFISGHAGMRFLPKSKLLFSLYYHLDQWMAAVSDRLCTQLILTAQKPT